MLNHGSYYVLQADSTVKHTLSNSGLEREDSSEGEKLLEVKRIFHQLSPPFRLTQAAREGPNFPCKSPFLAGGRNLKKAAGLLA